MISAEDLFQIIDNVCSAALGASVQRINQTVKESEFSVAGCVHITGGWQGAVICQFSTALAQHFAAMMFDLPEADLGDDEVRDAVGEIGNMLAGNVKAVLSTGTGTELSLPTVVTGQGFHIELPENILIAEVACESEGRPLMVRLFGRGTKPHRATKEVSRA